MTHTDEVERLARFAALLSDRTRAAFCLALLDGRAWTAGELAAHVGVARSTATEHLHRLTEGGVLSEQRQGRHRYVRLAGPSIARLIEDLTAQFPGQTAPVTGMKAAVKAGALARGRTCYDHLAGRLGVAVTRTMIERRLLDDTGGFTLTAAGFDWFTDTLDVDVSVWRQSRRPVARTCLDWTERREHLAGLAGAGLCRGFLDRGWVRRVGSGRAVRLTPSGTGALRTYLGMDTAQLNLDG